MDSYAELYGGTIADRAKTRSRKPSQKEKETPEPTDIIELTSEEEFDPLFSSPRPKQSKAKQTRQPSPYADSIYGPDAIPSTFPDALLAPPAPVPPSSAPYPDLSSPPVQDLPPIAFLMDKDSSQSVLSNHTGEKDTFFAPSPSLVPTPSNPDDSGVADLSTSTTATKKSKKSKQADESTSGSKPKPKKKGEKADKVGPPKGKKKNAKAVALEVEPMEEDKDELDVITTEREPPQPPPPLQKYKPINDESDLSSVPASEPEEELSMPKTTKAARKRQVVVDSDEEQAPAKKPKKVASRKKKEVVPASEDEEFPLEPPPKEPQKSTRKTKSQPKAKRKNAKEPSPEVQPTPDEMPQPSPPPPAPPEPQASTPPSPPPVREARPMGTPRPRSSNLVPRRTSTPMSDLIRKVNSQPGSPFVSSPGTSSSYSPYAKTSRSMLSRIAPLHPNRKPPPPPLPPPPPRKKTKKEIEREEQWEEELIESVGGQEQWICMTDDERRDMRRAKREMEMAGWED